ncbi:MAG: dihydrofolate reductase family protein [Candidatus Acidiferrales bacterium]
MRKLIVFDHITLDGYFCGPNGDMSFFHNRFRDDEFHAFAVDNIKAAGGLLFGRITYELMAAHWPTPNAIKNDPVVAERMNSLPKFVFSRTLAKTPWNNTHLLKGDLVSEVRKLKEVSGNRMAILGSGNIVAQLASHGLIDEYEIVVNPVAIGAGRAMFHGINEPLQLQLTKTRTFRNGNVLLCYEPMA